MRVTDLPNMAPEVERGLRHFRTMLLIRAFEEAVVKARLANTIRGSVHEYIGEEGIATGVCANLERRGLHRSYHRGHGHSIAKGADPGAMMMELYGRKGGTCGGKGGSMHVADFSLGMLGANGVMADGVTIAVGAAQAVKLLGKDRIVVAFFGDGAINRGPMLESFNWARVFDLPVLFVCEDNYIRRDDAHPDVTAGPGPRARAASFGIRGETVDGNDVIAVDEAAARLIREGPRRRRADAPARHDVSLVRGHLAPDKGQLPQAREELAMRPGPDHPLRGLAQASGHRRGLRSRARRKRDRRPDRGAPSPRPRTHPGPAFAEFLRRRSGRGSADMAR